jgi:hypothetical protein
MRRTNCGTINLCPDNSVLKHGPAHLLSFNSMKVGGFQNETLSIGLFTNVSGAVEYFLIDFLSPSTYKASGMVYENTVIVDCSVVLAELVQTLNSPVQDQVQYSYPFENKLKSRLG